MDHLIHTILAALTREVITAMASSTVIRPTAVDALVSDAMSARRLAARAPSCCTSNCICAEFCPLHARFSTAYNLLALAQARWHPRAERPAIPAAESLTLSLMS